MRLILLSLRTVLLCLLVGTSAPAYAGYLDSEKWFNSMSEKERILLQSDLILLGHYQALADSEFGNFTFKSLKDFQSALGAAPTGTLTDHQLDILRERASKIYRNLGFDVVKDLRGRMSMLLPQTLLPNVSDTRRGTSYASVDGTIHLETIRKPLSEESFESLFRTLSARTAKRDIRYQVLDADKFVVSGVRDGRSFYLLINKAPGESAGFSLEWDPTQDQLGAMLATFMASYSYPLAYSQTEKSDEVADADNVPSDKPAAPKLFSGTGFFVAENGVLVTNHHVVESCSTIDIVGYGAARVVTSDEDIDLAVVQLRDRKAHGIAHIRREPAELGETVIALGFPLADLLNSSLNVGTGIVSSETGFRGEKTRFTTNVGIQPGNSGGPILDENGFVVGVAVTKIDDSALLAEVGTTAPNIGFAIKGEAIADYLNLFRLPDSPAKPAAPMSVRDLAEVGRKFTVQVLCKE